VSDSPTQALIKPTAVEEAADRLVRIIKPRVANRGNRVTDASASTGLQLGRGKRMAKPRIWSNYDVRSAPASAQKKSRK
jgi:hypothetical protein